jgi:hypothetical protein
LLTTSQAPTSGSKQKTVVARLYLFNDILIVALKHKMPMATMITDEFKFKCLINLEEAQIEPSDLTGKQVLVNLIEHK